MRVTVTGATGLIGTTLVARLLDEGAEVTVLSRDPARAEATFGAQGGAGHGVQGRATRGVQAVGWDLLNERAPTQALEGRDAVVHLAGENVAQRWTASAKRAIRESRVIGTRHLVEGLRECGPKNGADSGAGARSAGGVGSESGSDSGSGKGNEAGANRPKVLVSASAVGYYGAHGEEPLDEEAPPGRELLGEVCVAWEAQARAAQELGMRTVQVRIGVVLDRHGGALAKMLPPFRLGLGGPIAGGHQYVSWVHVEDLVGIVYAALADERWSGPVNGTAPEPVTNRELSRALGHALHRPALLPVPGAALRALYGEMAQVVTTGARVLPVKPLMLGYEFRYPHLDEALNAALDKRQHV
jgi:NAD dependent epimerase/dehydratase family enzyme